MKLQQIIGWLYFYIFMAFDGRPPLPCSIIVRKAMQLVNDGVGAEPFGQDHRHPGSHLDGGAEIVQMRSGHPGMVSHWKRGQPCTRCTACLGHFTSEW